MDARILLTIFAALFTQPFFVHPATHTCPSKCKCQSIYKTLCKNITLTDVPSGVTDTTITLDVSHNNISRLTAASFTNKGVSQLTSLYIYNNAIRNIDPEAFRSLANLKSLFIGMNKLTHIHPDTFARNTKIEELDLHGNSFSLGDEWPFQSLVSLCVLNLSDCNLSNIPEEAFQKTVNLSRLDVSKNKLTYIDDHLFANLKSLTFLNLSVNLLISVDFLQVISTANLRNIDLYLYNNMLDNISDEVLKRMAYLKNLSIHQNPFLCSCFDRNCSKYIKNWETPVGNCLNKTTSAPIRKASIAIINTDIGPATINTDIGPATTNTDIGPTKISVNEEALTRDPRSTDEGMTVVTNSPTGQESSQKPLEATVVIYVSVLSVVIILVTLIVTLIVTFVFRWIMKKRSFSTEYDSVQHEQQNWQQQRSCYVCHIYENYTPICDHKISRQNTDKHKKGELNFATLGTLEDYETIKMEETEESCLYTPTNEEQSTQCIDSNNDSGHSSQMPLPVPRSEVNQNVHNIQ